MPPRLRSADVPEPERRPMRAEVVTVNPALASEWLAKTASRQRELQPANMKYLTLLMKNGDFLSGSPDPIVFDTNDELIQGQHRLQALCNTNSVLDFLVVHDAPVEAFAVLDKGLMRRVDQFLDHPQAKLIVSAARQLYQVEARLPIVQFQRNPGNWLYLSLDQQLDYVTGQWPELETWASAAYAAAHGGSVFKVPARFLLPIVVQAVRTEDGHRVGEFLAGFKSGKGLSGETDPRYHLNRRFTSAGAHLLTGTAGQDHAYTVVARTWNAWIKGEQFPDRTGFLQVRSGQRRAVVDGTDLAASSELEPLLTSRGSKVLSARPDLSSLT